MKRLTSNFYGCNQIADCSNDMCYETCDKYKDCTECPIKKAIDRLAEYEDAEEQELLLRLPCKPGDVVYQLEKHSGRITPRKVQKLEIVISAAEQRGYSMAIFFEDAGFCLGSFFGKTFFRDKSEAMQALTEYQNRDST